MSLRLPISLPAARYQAHATELNKAVARVFRSGRFILGDETAAFEEDFANFLGAAQAIGVGSGTDALEIALRACGIGRGDAVLTVAHTATATVAAIERAGAVPVLVDIDEATFTMDPEHLDATIRDYRQGARTAQRPPLKAVIPVHLYGHPADMIALRKAARAHDLFVIEDCAQAHGALLNGQATGTWGDLAAFSFYPTKNLGAFGDGGAVVTNDTRLANKARALREYGWKQRHVSTVPGLNSRLDELQAALLRVLLRHLPIENAHRRLLAEDYARGLEELDLVLPRTAEKTVPVFHQYVVKSGRRDHLQQALQERGIATQIHYPVPIHLQPAYRDRLFIRRGGLPKTEAVVRQILSLPMSPHLYRKHIETTCAAVRRALTSLRPRP